MIKFKHPFTKIVTGPTGSGKSSYCINFIKYLESVCTESDFKGGIVWCYSEKTAVPSQQLAPLGKKITYHEGVLDFTNKSCKPALLILDDLLDSAFSKNVSALFTRGSHHQNISVILITQNIFHQERYSRTISLNAKYIVAFKNVRDKNQFLYLARQVCPEDSVGLFKAYLDATARPHGYIVLDLSQDSDDRLRYRTNIFPHEYPPIIYAPLGDETNKVKLEYFETS